MEGKDNIKELFSQKLGNFEAPVNPELWAKISSQVAAASTATAASSGLSMLAKVAIGIGVSTAAIATVVVLSTSSDSDKEARNLPNTVLQESEAESVKTVDAETNAQNGAAQESVRTSHVETNQRELEPSLGTTLSTEFDPANNEVNREVFTVINMNPKGINGGIQSEGNEPEIVQGIAYSEVTTYGAEPANSEEYEVEESTAANVAPIKRFVDVFTPNGDNKNDEFFLESEGLTDFTIVVFNPVGEIVYTSDDPNFRWDGRDIRTNLIVPPGNYMYMVTAYDSEKNPYPIYEKLEIRE